MGERRCRPSEAPGDDGLDECVARENPGKGDSSRAVMEQAQRLMESSPKRSGCPGISYHLTGCFGSITFTFSEEFLFPFGGTFSFVGMPRQQNVCSEGFPNPHLLGVRGALGS